MDPLFGPGPWTTFMDRVHGPPVMDQVPGQFFLLERFAPGQWTLKNRNSAKKRFDETLSTNAYDWSQIFSCGYMTYTPACTCAVARLLN